MEKTMRYEIEIIDIDGIPYYVDKRHNVFRHETIGKPDPEMVARWELNETGKYVIVPLNSKKIST
jgi:hypothetical protein